MRIRHYFSHLSINSASASYDVRQGFDKQFCVDFIEDCAAANGNDSNTQSHINNRDRKCQTAPRKPCRPSLGGAGGTSSTSGTSGQNSVSAPRSSSVPALVSSDNSKVCMRKKIIFLSIKISSRILRSPIHKIYYLIG